MAKQTYYSYLESLRKDAGLIDREKRRLDDLIEASARKIKARVTPETAGGLVWALGLKELSRTASLVGIPLSDFAGHARHLRALAAAVPNIKDGPSADPGLESLLEYCDRMWLAVFHRELIDDLKRTCEGKVDRARRMYGGMMSLLGAFQGEVEYIEQAEHRTIALFTPFSRNLIEPALGLSVQQISQGFSSLRAELARRLNHGGELMEPSIQKWREWKDAASKGVPTEVLNSRVRQDPQLERTGEQLKAGMSLLTHVLEFSVEDFAGTLGEAAADFLKAFSFTPGTINQEYLTPFCRDEVRARPFARVGDDRYLLFDPCYCFWAPLYRLPTLFTTPQQQQKLTKRRDRLLEEDVALLLEPVVQPTLKLDNYFVAAATDGQLAERDLLLFREGTLILVESKAQSFRPVFEHRGDLNRIIHLVRSSIQKGYDQACSVYRALRDSTVDVVFYDSDKPTRTEIARLGHQSVKEVFAIVCLDDWYGFVATDLSPWIEVDTSIGYPWVVDRNTLEAIVLKIDNLDKLTRFLRWRQSVQGLAVNEDEAVFAGFYAAHGPVQFPEQADVVQLDANYGDILEAAYFRKRGLDVPEPKPAAKPVFTQTRREGDDLIFEIDGKVEEVIDFRTGGQSVSAFAREHLPKQIRWPRRIGRNDPCPCGSGLKYKKCCGTGDDLRVSEEI